jgi:transcriptional regulator with XRE-family HTH domain
MVIPTFGPILKATRVALRLSRAELAARAGLDESAIGHFERGFRSPTYTSAAALAAALGVSLDWFLPGITRGVFGSPELALVRAEAIAETERWARDEASNSGGLEEAPPSSSALVVAGPDA